MLAYLLETTVCWAAFYLLYHLLLRRETFFRLNRCYLLGTAALGLLIPALDLNGLFSSGDKLANFYLPVVTIGAAELKTVVVERATESVCFQAILAWIYWLGAAAALAKLGYGLLQIFRLHRQGELSPGNGYRFVATRRQHVPFSFLNHIFWSREFQTSDEDRRIILCHEEAHIFQRHSFDVLFFETLGVIFWCSPPLWFYKKALKTTHEYLADAHVLASENKKQYGRLLLRQSQSGMQVAISNSLFHSQLKQRIVMMSKLKSPQRASVKYLVALPLLALLCLAFSFELPLAKAQTPLAPEAEVHLSNEVSLPNQANLTNEIASLNELNQEPQLSPLGEIAPLNEINLPKQAVQPDSIPGASGEIFKVVEDAPRFPGCEDLTGEAERNQCSMTKLMEFISQNIRYPAEARQKGIEGMVVVRFVVEKDGSISQSEIIKKVGGGCDEEVLRMMSAMPKWIPGMEKGKLVRVQFNLPVKFKLDAADVAKTAAAAPKAEIFEAFPNPAGAGGFNVKFKTAPGDIFLLFRDAAGKDLIEKPFRNYDGTEWTEKISTKGLFENAANGSVFVSLMDAKGQVLGSTTVVVQ